MEGSAFKNTIKKVFKGSKEAWNPFLRPAVNTLAPIIGMALGTKSNDPQVGQATTSTLESRSGVEILLLTDIHGIGLG